MSTPNQPNDKDVERGAVAPPWKRGEQTAATGLTAGEMAKAAGVVGDDRAGGQPPRGPASDQSGTAQSGSSQSAPSQSGSSQAGGSQSGASQSGASQTGAPQTGSPRPQGPSAPSSRPSSSGPQSGPIAAPGPQPKPAPSAPQSSSPQSSSPQSSAKPASGPQPQVPQPQVPQPQPPQPQAPQPAKSAAAPASAKPAPAPAPSKPFVESETRNIPRERLASKDELPDLDSIHHSEQALARAASQTIPARASSTTPLRAAVQIRRVDPWSIFKVSGVLCIAGFFIWMIAVAILYGVLGGMGIWDQINSSADTIVNGDGSSSGQDLISGGQVFMFSALFGIVGAVMLTGLATISAYIYNVCADFVGGVEVTLADLD